MQVGSRLWYEASIGYQPLGQSFGFEETGPQLGHVPARRADGTGEHDPDPVYLPHTHQSAGVLPTELPRHAEPQRGLPQFVLRNILEKDVSYLDQRPAPRTESPVAGRRIEQPW